MPRKRSRLGAFLAASALIAAGLTAAPPAVAAPDALSNGVNTAFEIDGDMAGGHDWDALRAGNWYGPGLTPSGHKTTGILGFADTLDQDPGEYCLLPGVNTQPEVTDVFQQFMQVLAGDIEYPLHPAAPNIQRVLEAGSKAELVGLAAEFDVDEKRAKGLTVRDLRKLLLVKFSGVAAD